jgi:hypothetical protein
MVLSINRDYFLEQHKQMMFVMVKCCVLFEVQTEFLTVI